MKAKSNMNYSVLGQQDVPPDKRVVSDRLITLSGDTTHERYPAKLRLVTYCDQKTDKEHVFVANNFKTKCRHSIHELTRIVGEPLLDSVYLIEILTIPFDIFKVVTLKQQQLSLSLKF